MKINEIKVGTILEMKPGGGEYRVVRIEGDEVELEHTRIAAEVEVYLSDLPEIFSNVEAKK
jgi:hypothetical protein